MGSAYAKLVSQNRRPRVALLSNGAEAGKGPTVGAAGERRAGRDHRAQLHRQHRRARHPARRRRRRRDERASSATSCSKMLEGVERDRRAARALRAQGAARVAARPGRAVVGDRPAQVDHRLAAVRRRAAARVHAPVHQGARPLERARDRERGQGRAQGADRQPVRQHRAHDGRARRARAALRHAGEADDVLAGPVRQVAACGSASASGCSSPTSRRCRRARRPPRHTFRWDLDKTYLRTEFDSLNDLAKSAIETAADKQAFPGATAMLRALRQDDHRICIVSGSPTQMRQVLAAKLALDGIEYDEFVLKNNLKNILRGRFRALRAQIPYKLPAMLRSRIAAARRARDAVRRRRRGRRDHLLPVRRSRRGPRVADRSRARARPRRARTTTTRSTASISRARVPKGRCRAPHVHPPRSALAAARVSPVRAAAGAGVQLLPGRARALRGQGAVGAPGHLRRARDARLRPVRARPPRDERAGRRAPRPDHARVRAAAGRRGRRRRDLGRAVGPRRIFRRSSASPRRFARACASSAARRREIPARRAARLRAPRRRRARAPPHPAASAASP